MSSYRERVEAIRTGGTLAGQKVRLRCIDIAAEADARIAELEAENAALRGAMPDAQMLDSHAAGIEWEGYEAVGLRQAAARIRALSATPTPPATEAPRSEFGTLGEYLDAQEATDGV